MPRISAGILLYRTINKELEIFLVHPGGPFFKNKDEGYWSIPKGEVEKGENYLQTAIREFNEETGITATGDFIELGSVVQKGGKIVHAWACEYTKNDEPVITSNEVLLTWPPLIGKKISFPEVDKGFFFTVKRACKKIKPTQLPLIERLEEFLIKKTGL